MEVYSIFTITTRDGKVHEGEAIEGSGQDVMKFLRKIYPRLTKFVLEGFEIDGVFKRLSLRTQNYIR